MGKRGREPFRGKDVINWRKRKDTWIRAAEIRGGLYEELDVFTKKGVKSAQHYRPLPVEMIHACAIIQCPPSNVNTKKCNTCNYGSNGLFPVCEEVEKRFDSIRREVSV